MEPHGMLGAIGAKCTGRGIWWRALSWAGQAQIGILERFTEVAKGPWAAATVGNCYCDDCGVPPPHPVVGCSLLNCKEDYGPGRSPRELPAQSFSTFKDWIHLFYNSPAQQKQNANQAAWGAQWQSCLPSEQRSWVWSSPAHASVHVCAQ
jgi:hypothetical protein